MIDSNRETKDAENHNRFRSKADLLKETRERTACLESTLSTLKADLRKCEQKKSDNELQLAKSKKNANEMIQKCKKKEEKIAKLEEQIQKMSEECETHITAANSYKEMNSNLQRELRAQNDLIAIQKAQLKSLEQELSKGKEKPNDSHDAIMTDTNNTIKLIMDSNRKVVVQPLLEALPESTIEVVETCYSTTDLKHYFEDNRQNLTDKTVFVMMGTNDIIKSKDRKAVKNIRAMREEVPDNTHFIHIPPQRTTNIANFDKMADNTRKGLNEMYDKYFNTIPLPAIEENPGMYHIRDGYHLNDDAGKYIATEIKNQLTIQSRAIMKGNLPARVITQETCYKTTVKIPKAIMKHILGTEGTKIRAINEKNGTTTTNKEVRQDETIIEIKGSTDSVEETKRDIQEQLKRRERDAEMKKLCGKKQCNFIGRCRYGDLCWYSHKQQSTEPTSILKSPSRRNQVRYEHTEEPHQSENSEHPTSHRDYQDNRHIHDGNNYRQHAAEDRSRKSTHTTMPIETAVDLALQIDTKEETPH